jgi:hypothetical protein
MFLPPDLSWLEPVLIAAAVVFVVDLIGNMLSFSNRLVNALVTALVFAVIFGTLFGLAFKDGWSPTAIFMPAEFAWLEPVLISSGIVFVVGLIGNLLSFSNRFVNALVTAIVFAAIFGTLSYLAYKDGAPVPTLSVPTPETPAPATPAP